MARDDQSMRMIGYAGDGRITHDACLPSFHHGTCPRRLNCQVFTSGRFIFLYFFDFLTLDLAGMILAFFSYFWLFVQIFLDFLDIFGFCRFFTFLAFLLVGTTRCGMEGIYATDGIRYG